VAAALVAFAALTSAGLFVPKTAFAEEDLCVLYPEICGEAEVEVIDHGTTDGSAWLHDEELRQQVLADMPIQRSGTPEHPIVAVDRKEVHFDHGVLPWINPATGRTLVPIRPIAEALGFTVNWTPDSPDEVTMERDGTSVHLVIGDNKATVNGEVVYMDQPSMLVNDARTMVPLRFVAEAFNCKVDWVGENGPDDPRVTGWDGGQYQIWIWAPWLYWGGYNLGDRWEATWNIRRDP